MGINIGSNIHHYAGGDYNYVLALKKNTLVAEKKGFFTRLKQFLFPSDYNIVRIREQCLQKGYNRNHDLDKAVVEALKERVIYFGNTYSQYEQVNFMEGNFNFDEYNGAYS